MSDGMGREPAYLSSHATNRYFIPNWGTTCIGYVVSGKLTVGDKVKLNFALGNGEHTPKLDDNDVLSAKVTWIETNGTELTTKAIANQTLSFGLDIERYLLPETISSVEHYKV